MALSEYSKRLLGAYAEQPFLMAPMAGVTDPAYRIMCRRRGANLAYSEMVSVAGLAFASNKTWRLVLPADEDDCIPVWLQADYAKAWAAEEWANCEPYAVPLKTWLDRWVKGMEEDGLAVAVFPLPEAIGVVEDPADVADNLLRQMSKQNRKKK